MVAESVASVCVPTVIVIPVASHLAISFPREAENVTGCTFGLSVSRPRAVSAAKFMLVRRDPEVNMLRSIGRGCLSDCEPCLPVTTDIARDDRLLPTGNGTAREGH